VETEQSIMDVVMETHDVQQVNKVKHLVVQQKQQQ
jgi:hypothetical protein